MRHHGLSSSKRRWDRLLVSLSQLERMGSSLSLLIALSQDWQSGREGVLVILGA
ncbi:hypothetical protein D3C79_557520 [compost metagenome]